MVYLEQVLDAISNDPRHIEGRSSRSELSTESLEVVVKWMKFFPLSESHLEALSRYPVRSHGGVFFAGDVLEALIHVTQ